MKRKSDLPPEQIALLVEQAEADKGYKVCGYASLLEDGTTVVCRNPAGRETDHLGLGNCKYHGGCGAGKTTGGLYSKYTQSDPSIMDRIKEFADDEDIKKLDNEIVLLRTKVSKVIENKETWDGQKFDFALVRLIDLIGRSIERKHKIESGEKYVITIENLDVFLKQIMGILKVEIHDNDLLIKILKRMQDEVKV